jgi:hypothetical protein
MFLPSSTYNEYNNLDIIEKKDVFKIVAFLETIVNFNSNIFSKQFNYVRRLKYNQEPNYEYVNTLLCNLIK